MRIRLAAVSGVLVLAGSTPGLTQDGVEAAWRAALAASPTPHTLQTEQRLWREDRARAATADLGGMDEARAEDLRAMRARDLETAAARPRLFDLLAGCAPLGLDGCSAEGGWLQVTDDRILFWQTQRGTTDEEGLTGAAILLAGRPDGPLAPVAWVRGGFFSAPVVVTDENGAAYVAVPGFHAGTGRHNADVVFRWTGESERPLVQIDNTAWTADLAARLPSGLEVWKGVDIDYKALVAWTPLWRPDDGNCCASGGTAILNFRLEADRLALDSVTARDAIVEVASSAPLEVVEFVGRAASCTHWAGEEPYDDARRAEIEAALTADRCEALPADAVRLRAKYVGDASLLPLITRVWPD